MSVDGWQSRLAKRGLALDLAPSRGPYSLAFVTEIKHPNELVGCGASGVSQDAAIRTALRDFDTKHEQRERARVVDALADPSAAEARLRQERSKWP